MNLTVEFNPLAETALGPWRQEYLNSLPFAQEPLLETLVPEACAYEVVGRNGPCGYLLVSKSRALFEFYLNRQHWVFAETVLAQALAALQLERAVVKTFDALLLSAAMELQSSVRSLGLLVRDLVDRSLPEMPRVKYTMRTALPTELEQVRSVEQHVFTDLGRTERALASGHVRLFERDDVLIGFGLLSPVAGSSDAVDVGIAVDIRFRNKGYAVYMLRDLVRECLHGGKTPVAGCSGDNLPSRRMGERVGFVARHRLLEVGFNGGGRARQKPAG